MTTREKIEKTVSNEVYLVTRNPGKLMAAKRVFDAYDITLKQLDVDYPEIQASSSLEIAKYTATQAVRENGVPVIREDHSIFFNALNFPGPFANYAERVISAEKLLTIINAFSDRSGYFEIATVYADPAGRCIENVFQVKLTIGSEIKGSRKDGWNSLIRIQNETRALTEYPEEERVEIWGQGYKSIAEKLSGTL